MEMLSSLHQLKGILPLYIMAVAVYLIPNVPEDVLFLFPMLWLWIETQTGSWLDSSYGGHSYIFMFRYTLLISFNYALIIFADGYQLYYSIGKKFARLLFVCCEVNSDMIFGFESSRKIG